MTPEEIRAKAFELAQDGVPMDRAAGVILTPKDFWENVAMIETYITTGETPPQEAILS